MRAPKRAMINFIIDAAIAVAFVALAVSGLVFMLPAGWRQMTGGTDPSVLAVSLAVWRSIHDWSALVMVTGVVLHTALHWRWIVAMTRKTFKVAPRAAKSSRRPGVPAAGTPGARPAPRRTRREVLTTGGALAAAVLIGGAAGRALAVAWLDGEAQAGDPARSAAADGLSGAASGGSSSGWADSSGSTDSAEAFTSDRIAIDPARCDDCGRCLPSCPYGVFGWSGDSVVVAEESACRLCGRCLQACPAAAIRLNA